MPTEHEYKYVVNQGFLLYYSEEQLKKSADAHIHIKQGYLAFSKGMSCRVRCAVEFDKTKWFLTLKQKVSDRVIEIEKKLDERDGRDLWDIAVGKLKKDRYVFDHHGIKWEIDLFKNDDQLYFLLAEVELPEGSPRPKHTLPFLKEWILHEVPLTDDRFSNKRLGDVNYARQIYNEMLAVGEKK